MRFDIITIFPQLIEAFSQESLLKRAQKKKLLQIKVHDLRRWAKDKHKTVDDKPYGGGLGMVLKIGPIYRAVQFSKSKVQSPAFAKASAGRQKSKVILFTPRGKKFTQKMAYEFSRLDQLIMICGRYEGVDERVAKHIADEELSIGDYVLMGGEVPAMTVIETVSRLILGVVGKPAFLKERNLRGSKGSPRGFLEYPQYTRPEIFEVPPSPLGLRSGFRRAMWKVPKVLLSGDHKKIGEWKAKHGRIIGKDNNS